LWVRGTGEKPSLLLENLFLLSCFFLHPVLPPYYGKGALCCVMECGAVQNEVIEIIEMHSIGAECECACG
jgi:hypothetical protein